MKQLSDERYHNKTAFILGSESEGVSKKILENSDFIISIPILKNVESLNVSTAAAIALYEFKRQFRN